MGPTNVLETSSDDQEEVCPNRAWMSVCINPKTNLYKMVVYNSGLVEIKPGWYVPRIEEGRFWENISGRLCRQEQSRIWWSSIWWHQWANLLSLLSSICITARSSSRSHPPTFPSTFPSTIYTYYSFSSLLAS